MYYFGSNLDDEFAHIHLCKPGLAYANSKRRTSASAYKCNKVYVYARRNSYAASVAVMYKY